MAGETMLEPVVKPKKLSNITNLKKEDDVLTKRKKCAAAATSSSSATGDNVRAFSFKEEGNKFFGQKKYEKAVTAYRLGLALYNDNSFFDLAVALRSNLAMALLKLDDYAKALEECDAGISLFCEDDNNKSNNEERSNSNTITSHAKLYYRRALAKEGLRRWEEARDDLQKCMNLFDNDDVNNNNEKKLSVAQERMKEAAIAARERIQKAQSLAELEARKQHNVNEQRKTVILLLQARCESLKPALTKTDEAFFLLDWNWWQRWCHVVNLFEERKEEIISLFPPGAIIPSYDEDKMDDDDDDDDSMDVDDDELGPIDNSKLLLGSSPDDSYASFTQHWYSPLDPETTAAPNLVRGYHYEIIPREVYQALSTWYGEITVPICRRISSQNTIKLYNTSLRQKQIFQQQKELVHYCAACHAPHAKARCKQCLSVYYCSRSCQESNWPYHKHACIKATTTTFNNKKKIRIPGRVGLHNLGNTCFMNSALQCLSHATPLTRHFLSQAFLKDLNPDNPLGTRGKLANAYDQMLRELHMGSNLAMSPTSLKLAIARFAPRFAGCSQHDATEFLAYLLDGLHEDLNRIRKAPYVESPDIDDNSNMAIAGAEAWNGHLRRNDSLVLQTFYGQFKSTCVCPRCRRVSVSFDAFNHVSLEIPQPKTNRYIPVIVFPTLKENKKRQESPVRWMVQVKRGSFVTDIKQALSKLCGIPIERIALCDLYDYNIYEILPDNKNVNTIRTIDVLAAYEVDPYTDTTLHVIATNKAVSPSTDSNDDDEIIEEDNTCSDDENNNNNGDDLFGFPMLTSFRATMTCREVCEHLWTQYQYVQGLEKEWMNVCITDNNGKPTALFPGNSSFLPSKSDEKIADYLGKDCTERFLFCQVQWSLATTTSAEKENPADDNDTVFDKGAFLKLTDHDTYIEGLKQSNAATNIGVSLDQCFQTFTRPERLDENNMWYCNKCKEHVRALKTMELWRLPNILVVHLKRFEFKQFSNRRDKLDTFVDFPLEGLDMSQYCGQQKNSHSSFVQDAIPAMYDLFAVTNHFGRLGFGHYTAFARPWDEVKGMGDWALFDDSSVRTNILKSNVVTPAAYVLFYRRRIFS